MGKMIKCSSCGSDMAKSAVMCPQCGKIAPKKGKICKSCGKEILKNAVICPNCGAKQKKKRHPILGSLFLLIAVIFFVAALTPTSSNAPAEKPVYTIGDRVEHSNIAVTLNNVEEISGNSLLNPASGNIYIICEFTIENNSSKDIAVSSMLCFDAYANGFATQISFPAIAAAGGVGGNSTLDAQVAAGKKINGIIGYEIPKDFSEFEIRVAPNFWAGQKIAFVINK